MDKLYWKYLQTEKKSIITSAITKGTYNDAIPELKKHIISIFSKPVQPSTSTEQKTTQSTVFPSTSTVANIGADTTFPLSSSKDTQHIGEEKDPVNKTPSAQGKRKAASPLVLSSNDEKNPKEIQPEKAKPGKPTTASIAEKQKSLIEDLESYFQNHVFGMISDDNTETIKNMGNSLTPVFIIDDPAFISATLINNFKNSQFFIILEFPEHQAPIEKTLGDMSAVVVDTLAAVYTVEPKYRNTAFVATIDRFYPEKKRGNLGSKWVYTLIVMVVVVLMLILLAYLNKKHT